MAEQKNIPLQADLAEVANTETKESNADSQTKSDSLTADASCPDVGERSENLLQSEAKSQEANLLQTSGAADVSHSLTPDVGERSENLLQSEAKIQEANLLQTSGHSLAADVSHCLAPDVGERSENLLQSEAKSQEANLLQTSSHSLAADASSSSVHEQQSVEKSQEAKDGGDNDQIVPSS